jgi:dihydrofolate reductase
MRKVILSLATSLDGYIEGPNGEVDWMVFTEDTGKALGKFLNEIDTILYGRVSYEAWGTYVPPENAPAFEKNFYERTGSMSKYVFSTSKAKFQGSPVVVKSGIQQAVHTIKQESGKDIWLYGGAGLITDFVNLDLIDEYRIAIMPIILGSGKPLFADIKKRVKLKLQSVDSGESGFVELNYVRQK